MLNKIPTSIVVAIAIVVVAIASFVGGTQATPSNLSSMLIVVELKDGGVTVNPTSSDWACSDVPGIPNGNELLAGKLCERVY